MFSLTFIYLTTKFTILIFGSSCHILFIPSSKIVVLNLHAHISWWISQSKYFWLSCLKSQNHMAFLIISFLKTTSAATNIEEKKAINSSSHLDFLSNIKPIIHSVLSGHKLPISSYISHKSLKMPVAIWLNFGYWKMSRSDVCNILFTLF